MKCSLAVVGIVTLTTADVAFQMAASLYAAAIWYGCSKLNTYYPMLHGCATSLMCSCKCTNAVLRGAPAHVPVKAFAVRIKLSIAVCIAHLSKAVCAMAFFNSGHLRHSFVPAGPGSVLHYTWPEHMELSAICRWVSQCMIDCLAANVDCRAHTCLYHDASVSLVVLITHDSIP